MVNQQGNERIRQATLTVRGLVKEYPLRKSPVHVERIRAVDRVSFSVSPGQTIGIVGESGCGKSTVGKCVLKLIQADGGTILFGDKELHNLSDREFLPYRKHLQMVFQNPLVSFSPMLRIGTALEEPLKLRPDLGPKDRPAEVSRLLRAVGLDPSFAHRFPSEMSGGQLQRVGIARALAPEPKIVFLDEPTSALDMSIRGQIVNLLLDLQEQNELGYVIVSHDLRVVKFLADEVLVLYLGQVVEAGSRERVFKRPLHPYTRGLFAATLLGESDKTRRHRVQLRGELSGDSGTRGCKLRPRCPIAAPGCEEDQEILEAEPGHKVRCWRASQGG